jgi:hypothetical protein
VSAETHAKLRRAQDLLQHAIPGADVAAVFDQALDALLRHLEKTKFAAKVPRDRTTVRHTARLGQDVTSSDVQEPKANSPQATQSPGSDCPVPDEVVPEQVGGRRPQSARVGARSRRRKGSRYIPAAVRRAVWERDGGCCAFVGSNGQRCAERGRLEYHHRVPFAEGGKATIENLALACTAHNRYDAERFFGRDATLFTSHPLDTENGGP